MKAIKTRVSHRIFWPVLLGSRDSGRIMVAWCELRGAFHYFRTDRMIEATVLDDRIPERRSVLRTLWQAAMDEEWERYRQGADRVDRRSRLENSPMFLL